MIDTLLELVDFQQPSLYLFIASCFFNPMFWNVSARVEYRYQFLTRYLGFHNRDRACLIFAAAVFSLGAVRDYLYNYATDAFADCFRFLVAVLHQPVVGSLAPYTWIGVVSMILGGQFVVTSMLTLGITGTYMGSFGRRLFSRAWATTLAF